MKIALTLLLVVLFFLTVSLEWHIILIMLLVLVWRQPVKKFLTSYWNWGYVALWCVLGVAFIFSLPRYFALPSDRVRHYYVNKEGKTKLPPIHHWLLNAVLPEEELCNFGMKTARIAGPMAGLGKGLMQNYEVEQQRGTLSKMLQPYRRLSNSFENPMSAAYVQGMNDVLGTNDKSFYVIRPKHFDKEKSYPLVVFCHGMLGNWKLYNGILKDLDNCVVLLIGTRDLSGIFSDDELKEIHSLYIPMLEDMGYRVEQDNISILGLSNGGSAVNEAYRHFSSKFKNIVFISTPLHHSYAIPSKVLIIGGALDPSAPGMTEGYNGIRRRRGDVARYWKEDGTHYIFATESDSVIPFLNKELGLSQP